MQMKQLRPLINSLILFSRYEIYYTFMLMRTVTFRMKPSLHVIHVSACGERAVSSNVLADNFTVRPDNQISFVSQRAYYRMILSPRIPDNGTSYL